VTFHAHHADLSLNYTAHAGQADGILSDVYVMRHRQVSLGSWKWTVYGA
jgi:hypothetical protein